MSDPKGIGLTSGLHEYLLANGSAPDPETVAVRLFNEMVVADERVESVMLPISDGLTLIRRAY